MGLYVFITKKKLKGYIFAFLPFLLLSHSAEPMPAGSMMDLLLAKAYHIRHDSNASVMRKEKSY